MRITLLGGFEVTVEGRRIPPADWRRRHAAALVKLLALAPGRVLHREQVIDSLWPGRSLGEALPRLHKAAHFARRTLRQPRSLVLNGETVALVPDAGVDIDAVRFERLAESAHDARTAGAAADSYRGDLLPHDRYEAWTDEPRERLRLLYLRMLHQARRWHDIVNVDPADEGAQLELARGLAGAGDTRSALRQLARLERELHELGARPSTAALLLREELSGSPRIARQEFVIGAEPYGRAWDALIELCRGDPALQAGAAPIAVIVHVVSRS